MKENIMGFPTVTKTTNKLYYLLRYRLVKRRFPESFIENDSEFTKVQNTFIHFDNKEILIIHCCSTHQHAYLDGIPHVINSVFVLIK